MYILVTAANSSLAHKIKNSLNADSVLMGDYLELPEFLVKSGKMLILPDPSSSSYAHQMLALCLDKNIDKVYILRHPEKELLLASKQLFFEYGIDILAVDDSI